MCALLACKLYRLKRLFAQKTIGRKLFRALKYVYSNIKIVTLRMGGGFNGKNVWYNGHY